MREQRNKNFQLNARMIRGEAGKVARLCAEGLLYALHLGGEGEYLDSGFHRMAFGPAD
jgi:hypothetical protein